MLRIFTYLLFWLLLKVFFAINIVVANNTNYIVLSSQIARKKQLEIIANNAANINTIGYEENDILFHEENFKQNLKTKNSFVRAQTTYKSEDKGTLKTTDRNLDIAIAGDGYFKVITPRGFRYTLDGSIIINNQYVLVNIDGYPYSNREGKSITVPQNFQGIDIAQDGTIFIDNENIDKIGVFIFNGLNPLMKEGHRLYKTYADEILLDNPNIISRVLRSSNVNPTLIMAKMIEMQRSVSMTNNVMSQAIGLEKKIINIIGK